jgi:hypothetical protein
MSIFFVLIVDLRRPWGYRLALLALLAHAVACELGQRETTTAARATGVGAGARHALFGQGREWLLLEVYSHQVRRVRFPPGFEPTSISATSDGQWLVFTAFVPQADNTLLFKWDGREGSSPVSIGGERGYHAEVTVSLEGRKAYFSHHPLAGGPPGQHAAKANAQLYEVSLDGSGLRALTVGRGCHISPAAPAGNLLFFVYTPCDGTRFLSVLELASRRVTRVAEWGYIGETHLAPDGRHLLVASRTADSLTVYEVDVSTWEAVERLRYAHDSPSSRPQYGASRQQILFQNQGALWLFESGQTRRLLTLTEVTP